MDKQLVIIMEGPDGCGKTNIGQALAKELGIPYFKVDSEYDHWKKGKFKEALEFDQTYISQFLKQTGHSCIIDRAYPSEFCYSNVFYRETNHEVLQKVDESFASMNTVVVLCRRTWEGYKVVEDDLVDSVNKLHDLDGTYEVFKSWTKCNVVEMFVDKYHDDLGIQIPRLRGAIEAIGEAVTKMKLPPVKVTV